MAGTAATAETLRIATFAAPLSRDGPGLLLRDIEKGEDAQILAVRDIIAKVSPDILLLTNFDYDLDQKALAAFAGVTAYPHTFSLPTNAGLPSGADLDNNGRLREPRDMQGYGRFRGDGGMAILSRFPIAKDTVADFSEMLWQDLPGAVLPADITPEAQAVQRLSTTGHWRVPVNAPGGPVTLLASAHTPPVFDGPEDRNGLRNRDELRLWQLMLSGELGQRPVDFAILGNLNLDPMDGEGLRDGMRAMLGNAQLQDPQPQSKGAAAAADPSHRGDPALDTADWSDSGPGNLRVSYVLPAATWQVKDAGVFWPAPDDPDAALLGSDGFAAGPHRLVWVDISR